MSLIWRKWLTLTRLVMIKWKHWSGRSWMKLRGPRGVLSLMWWPIVHGFFRWRWASSVRRRKSLLRFKWLSLKVTTSLKLFLWRWWSLGCLPRRPSVLKLLTRPPNALARWFLWPRPRCLSPIWGPHVLRGSSRIVHLPWVREPRIPGILRLFLRSPVHVRIQGWFKPFIFIRWPSISQVWSLPCEWVWVAPKSTPILKFPRGRSPRGEIARGRPVEVVFSIRCRGPSKSVRRSREILLHWPWTLITQE